MAPKMGKVDIDYQALHDAFFRYQARTHAQIYHACTHARARCIGPTIPDAYIAATRAHKRTSLRRRNRG